MKRSRHDSEFLERDAQYLNLPADYIHELQTLADRYQETYSIFMKAGWAYLETIKQKTKRKYEIIIKPCSRNAHQGADSAHSQKALEAGVNHRPGNGESGEVLIAGDRLPAETQPASDSLVDA